MDATAQTPAQAPDWHALIAAESKNRPAAVISVTFLKRRASASQPVDLRCDDGNVYVIKALRNDTNQGRMMFNDHVVARFGALVGAPVPAVALVSVSQQLIDLNPDKGNGMGHIVPCIAHGSKLYDQVSERIDNIDHVHDDDNTSRFASLAILHAWMGFSDRQFIYDNASPFRVYSVDHGHFFPGGPNWTGAGLQNAADASVADDIVKTCKLDHDALVAARVPLVAVTPEQIASVLGTPPDEWGVDMNDRVALAGYIQKRQRQLAKAYTPQIQEAKSP